MNGLTQSHQSILWGVWWLTGLTCHFSRLSGGMGVDWLDTVTSVVYLMGLGVDWPDTFTLVVYLWGGGEGYGR